MFLIKTSVDRSAIHGNGVFASEPVAAGDTIWRFHPPFDQVFSEEQTKALPPAAKDFIDAYAYRSVQLGGKLVLSGDNAKFLNHSDDPNTEERPFASVARRAIAVGEEITCDYGVFCLDGIDFGGVDDAVRSTGAEPARAVKNQSPPHENLYTRLQVGANGIGVFAIRDIPAGTMLFAGNTGATTVVPAEQVETIDDDEIKRMYLDFCPLIEGAFVAPQDFNLITMDWYLNHSDRPNVVADSSLRFIASTFIPKGEELRADYTSYSDHASLFVKSWQGDRLKNSA